MLTKKNIRYDLTKHFRLVHVLLLHPTLEVIFRNNTPSDNMHSLQAKQVYIGFAVFDIQKNDYLRNRHNGLMLHSTEDLTLKIFNLIHSKRIKEMPVLLEKFFSKVNRAYEPNRYKLKKVLVVYG